MNSAKMINDFTNKEFIEEMKRRFIVPQWWDKGHIKERVEERIKQVKEEGRELDDELEELDDDFMDNLYDKVRNNWVRAIDEMLDEEVIDFVDDYSTDNYVEEEELDKD